MSAHLKKYRIFFLSGLLVVMVVLFKTLFNNSEKNKSSSLPVKAELIPDVSELSNSENDNLIRYGKNLIESTSRYLGPRGTVAAITNGLTCQHCHRESGTKLYTNNFLAVASTYPKFRERSGRVESVEFRINECLQRSLNGKAIDSLSKEMRAMVAYIKWTGKNVSANSKVEGAGSVEIPFLQRAADPLKGKLIFISRCKSCHGENGEGVKLTDSVAYTYPPLWGENSYAVSAGMYRLARLASFVKYNMPLGATYAVPFLSNEEAWDVAAFINTQPHPKTMFAYDWPEISTKPVDYPFGPYTDKFSEKQHKYGPFLPIKKAKVPAMKK